MSDAQPAAAAKVIVAVGADGRAYVPMEDHERLRRRAERLWAALVGISQLLGPLYERPDDQPDEQPDDKPAADL